MTTEKIPWTGGNKPTHNLCVKRKDGSGKFIQIGAGWQNDKGQINIRLDACVVLNWREVEDEFYLTLFPNAQGGRETPPENAE